MSATMAILTVGVVPVNAILPLLTEHISEQQITHFSLLGKMDPEDVLTDYGVDAGETPLPTRLRDDSIAMVSREKVERPAKRYRSDG